ncbi:TetR/AcrR family transcriptional regulator [Streptomyces sp. 12297]|uniref:TetR/AcrR family transcriptional regulator n=1 Tax=Streptomyces sp. NBC_00239 TaxID=2903640 RepID=UPI002E2B9983|nr:TetR family transcriptional regulator [Streptomyces sp. NBC_00239]
MPLQKSQITRRKLIDTARAEFAEHGIAGARVDRIAEHSGVNKQRIYAYFGNKEGLFAAVISDTYEELGRQVPVPDTIEGMRRYVGAVFDYHAANSDLVRLLAWEGLHYGSNDFPGREERQAYYVHKSAAFSDALGIDSPTEAAHLLFSLIAMASWPFVVEQQRRLMTEPPAVPGGGRELLRESITHYGRTLIDSLSTPTKT